MTPPILSRSDKARAQTTAETKIVFANARILPKGPNFVKIAALLDQPNGIALSDAIARQFCGLH
jgi:hypothetical protein